MDKISRLELIKARAKARPSLSPVAAEILEEVRKEDADLGGVALVSVSSSEGEEMESQRIEEEDEENTSLLSPNMRKFEEEERKELSRLEKEFSK